MKEERELNIMFQISGSGSVTTRISLPIAWVKKMGISALEKSVNVRFDGEKIIIEKGDNDMSKYVGMKWGELKEIERKEFLSNAHFDNETLALGCGENNSKEGILDLTEFLSVPAKLNEFDEVVVNDEAIIYDVRG